MKFAIAERRVECRGDHYIAPNATVIGSVVLEHDVSVWFNAVVRGDNELDHHRRRAPTSRTARCCTPTPAFR